jgi:hypothetical protein
MLLGGCHVALILAAGDVRTIAGQYKGLRTLRKNKENGYSVFYFSFQRRDQNLLSNWKPLQFSG